MNLEGIMVSEISQTEKDKYNVISGTSKKTELRETAEWWFPGAGRWWGKMGRNWNHENLEVWRRGCVGLWLRHLRKGS